MEAANMMIYVMSILQHLVTVYCHSDLRILGHNVDNRTQSGYGQFYTEGQWYTICNHGWGNNDASVFCREFGYDRGIPYHILDPDPESPTEPIWRAEITCTGDEDNLEQCTTRGVSKQCQPASVTCDKIDPSLEDGTLRLSDGPTPYSGRVDVAYEGLWGSICDRLWDETTAGVVCSMLGYQEGGMAIKHSIFGIARQVFLDAVRCSGGHETEISQCMTRGYLDQFCKLQRTAGVICLQESAQNLTGQIRLTHGQHPGEGIVEINYYGIWGGICPDVWEDTYTRVICQQLGYEAGTRSTTIFHRQFRPTWLSYVHCDGNETSILGCEHSQWEYLPCEPERVLRIECYNKDSLRDPGSTVSITLILYVGIPSGFVLLCVVIIITVLSRKPKVHKSQFVDGTIFNLEKQRSTRNPAYRLDFSLSSHSSLQRTPTTRSSGVYNYILDDEKDSAYLDLIDEKKEIELGPRSNVPLPVIPRYDADNYLCPISEEEVKDGQLRQGRAIRV